MSWFQIAIGTLKGRVFLACNLAYLAYLAYLATATQMKLKRTIRYHHLTRDFVDEASYPPTQEYILYSHNKVGQLPSQPGEHPLFTQQGRSATLPPRCTHSTQTTRKASYPSTQAYILHSNNNVSQLPYLPGIHPPLKQQGKPATHPHRIKSSTNKEGTPATLPPRNFYLLKQEGKPATFPSRIKPYIGTTQLER